MNIFENIDILEEREPETPSHKVYIQPNADVWTVSNMLFSMFVAQNKETLFSEIIAKEGLVLPVCMKDSDFAIGELTLKHNRLKTAENDTWFFYPSFAHTISEDRSYITFHIRTGNFIHQELYWFDFDIMKYISFEDKA